MLFSYRCQLQNFFFRIQIARRIARVTNQKSFGLGCYLFFKLFYRWQSKIIIKRRGNRHTHRIKSFRKTDIVCIIRFRNDNFIICISNSSNYIGKCFRASTSNDNILCRYIYSVLLVVLHHFFA